MQTLTRHFRTIIETVQRSPVLFACLWLGLFLIVFALLFQFDLVPTALSGDADSDESMTSSGAPTVFDANTAQAAQVGDVRDAPVRIIIDTIGVDIKINNPASRDITALDEALTSGAVHYPGSGDLEDTSNLFLFGHSSYLPDIINQSYTAFNGLEDLVDGDIIRVQSATKEYLYRVDTVSLVDANNTWVQLSNTEKKLTLSTCNTFGRKQDRFVVEARFIGSHPLNTEHNDSA